jgi:hypothetical protein
LPIVIEYVTVQVDAFYNCYLHTGCPLGFDTLLLGFVRPQPFTSPNVVSSTAAL